MSILNSKYPNLPAMLVSFKDGGMALRNDVTASKTDSILLLGTAVDGPVMEPFAPDDETVEAIAGKAVDENGVSNGSTLVKYYWQARKRGCNDIRLMRVTGSEAKAEIYGLTHEVEEKERVSEQFGISPGNEETVLNLANRNIVKDSCKIYVDGNLLLSGYVVEEVAGTVTINQGVCDAGKHVTVTYKYSSVEKIVNEKHTVAGGKVALAYKPMNGTIILKFGETAVEARHLTIKDNVVTINPDSGVSDDDEVTVSYDTIDGTQVVSSTENGTMSDPFITKSKTLAKVLSKVALADSVRLYVDGALFEQEREISVDAVKNEVSIDSKFFKIGAEITVEYLISNIVEEVETVTFETYFGGGVYNQGSIEVVEVKNDADQVIGVNILLHKPESKKGTLNEEALVFRSLDYRTLNDLVEAFNSHPKNNICKADTNAPGALTKNLKVTKNSFTGGDDGVNVTPQELFEALSGKRDKEGYLEKAGAYQLLEDYQVDWIVPVGVYADEILNGKYEDFAYELALACAVLSNRNKTTLGAIATRPCKDISLLGVQKHAKYLASLNNLYFIRDNAGNIMKGSDGQPIDLGMYISVVAGPETMEWDSNVGRFMGNPAVDYVAENAVMLPQSSPTNKSIKNAEALRYSFSNAQLNEITGNRIVTFKSINMRNGLSRIAMVDGVTSARPGSDYQRLTTSKVIRVTVDNVREVCEPFIGEANTDELRNSMAAAISKRLGLLKEKGVISDYGFQIVSSVKSTSLGAASIELTIVPPQELREITCVVGLKSN